MTTASEQPTPLSWAGALAIIGVVGLNTVFFIHDQAGVAGSLTAIHAWLSASAVHIGLGLLVTALIIYHQRRWATT